MKCHTTHCTRGLDLIEGYQTIPSISYPAGDLHVLISSAELEVLPLSREILHYSDSRVAAQLLLGFVLRQEGSCVLLLIENI